MTVFQILSLLTLGGLVVRDVWAWSRSPASIVFRGLRCLIWTAAGLAIADPMLVQDAAHLLGIGRGADVVLYLFVLSFLFAAFFFHTRCLRLEREITVLTRHLALRDAARGSDQNPPISTSG